MRSQISGLDVARRNSMDGISMLETAEGALGNTNAMLQRMRELAVQASNDTLTSNDRRYIQMEINELKDEIDRIAGTTQFNRKRILDGSSGAMWSSSDVGLKARINGGLTYTDEFGEKVSSEGNYRIEVASEPGQGQVQKSNIYNVATTEEYTITTTTTIIDKEEEVTEMGNDELDEYIDSVAERIDFNNLVEGASGDGWNFTDGTLNLTGNDKIYSIEGNGTVTTNKIKVQIGISVTVYLKDINIDVSATELACAFDLTNATVDMYLRGTNILKSGAGRAGLEVPDGSTLMLSSANGDGKTLGSLTAESDDFGSGIGGPGIPYSENKGRAGNITIYGGTIIAKGGYGAAGIGGGNTEGPDGGGTITINGGNITATGGELGAGIGSGYWASGNFSHVGDGGTRIVIARGIVNAISDGSGAAGIGGAFFSDSGIIRISNGMQDNIIATSGNIFIEDIGKGLGGNITDVEYVDMPEPEPRTRTKFLTHNEQVITTEMRLKPLTLSEISQFYNANGTFLVNQPQTITINQGNGKAANVTIYETDTIYEVADKINNAISDTLGQGKYTDNPNKFCTISDGTDNTSESIYEKEPIYSDEIFKKDNEGNYALYDDGNRIPLTDEERITGYKLYATMLVRSAIPGKAGELYFSGDQDILNALGLNTIQESHESAFTASIYDAHSGAPIKTGVKSTGGEFTSLIPPDIDIQVDHMAGLSASWDENTKRFMFVRSETYTAMLHLKDNATVFQTGANTGEDFVVQLGDASCNALGISGVNVVTRETASAAISTIDRAINKISSQRAKIGAYTNALEHTMTALSTTSANLTASESRIRDTDMAKTMMEFVKLNILNQSGISMLAQANQLPQSVLTLMQ